MVREAVFDRAGKSVVAALFVAGVPVGVITPRMAEIKAGIEATSGQFGTAFAFGALGALIGNYFGARAVHRYGTRAVARNIFIFALFQNFANAIVPNVEFLGLNSVFGGLIYSMMFVAINSQGVLVEQHRGKSFMPLAHGYFSLGAFLSALISSLIAPYFSVKSTLLVADILCIFAWYVASHGLLPTKYDDRPHDDPTQLQKNEKIPVDAMKFLIFIALAQTLSLWAEMSVGDWSSVLLHEDFKIAIGPNGYGFTVFVIVQLLTRYFTPRFVDKHGLHHVVRRMGFIGSSGYLAFLIAATYAAQTSATWALIFSCFAYGFISFGLAAMAPAFASAAGSIPRLPSARALMVIGMISAVALLVVRILLSYFAQATSLPFALLLMGISVAGAAMCSGLLDPKRVQSHAINREGRA